MVERRVGLPETALETVERWRREHICQTLLGLDALSHIILSTLLAGGRPWPRKALAAYLDVSPTTLLRRLRDLETDGAVRHCAKGWELTAPGSGFAASAVTETIEIVEGRQVGYSASVFEYLEHSKFKVSKGAKTVSFPPLSNLKPRN